MKRKVWLLLVIVPVLLAAYAVKTSLLPILVSGGEALLASRAPGTVTPGGSVPQIPTSGESGSADLDPFAQLDRQFDTQRTAETARFDEAEARIRARIQPALDASYAKYKLDMDRLDQINLNTDQKSQWRKQLTVQYEKDWRDLKGTIQPELDELAVQRKDALDQLESERTEKRTRLQEIQAQAEKGELDPIAAKRTQFDVLGISLPDSVFPSAQDHQMPADTEPAPRQEGPPRVTAIVATAEARFCALVEDALVSEGDTIRGYRVRKIHVASVEFEKDGQTWVQKAN